MAPPSLCRPSPAEVPLATAGPLVDSRALSWDERRASAAPHVHTLVDRNGAAIVFVDWVMHVMCIPDHSVLYVPDHSGSMSSNKGHLRTIAEQMQWEC